MKKFVGVCALLLLLISCSSDEDAFSNATCRGVVCAPGNLFLQFFDSETGKDVFFNNTYDIQDIVVTNVNTNEAFEFERGVSTQFETVQIALKPFFESQNDVSLDIGVPQGFQINVTFDVTYSEDQCCIMNRYSNVTFTGVTNTNNTEGASFYKVYL